MIFIKSLVLNFKHATPIEKNQRWPRWVTVAVAAQGVNSLTSVLGSNTTRCVIFVHPLCIMKEGQRKEYKTLGPKQNGKISSHIQMALILKSIRKRMNYAWKKGKLTVGAEES
ncbi:uncharacterized protein LOC144322564 isoform X2 [Canis aureus]